MNETSKWVIGILVTACAQVGAVAYMQGSVNTEVKAARDDISSLKGEISGVIREFDNLKTKVYTIKANTNENGIVLQRVDGKVSKMEGNISDYGNRIAILEFKSDRG